MSVQREVYTGTKITRLFEAAVLATDTDSAEVDTVGYGSLLLVGILGIEGVTLDANTHIQFQVEESDVSGSGFTDVANADLTNYVTGSVVGTFGLANAIAEAPGHFMTAYKGHKRYVRVRIEFTGTHGTGTPISVLAIQQHPSTSPVNATGNLD